MQQLEVKDTKFKAEIKAGGHLWRSQGNYMIKALYGTAIRTTETSFEYKSRILHTDESIDDTTLLGKDIKLNYEIEGGAIQKISKDTEASSIIIKLKALEKGKLTITLPRHLIDSKIGTEDDDFFVLIDGEEEILIKSLIRWTKHDRLSNLSLYILRLLERHSKALSIRCKKYIDIRLAQSSKERNKLSKRNTA